ncbi:MAG TPA: terminase family protein [Caulobacteraceae bacterium]|jgi:hypothetical protein|nr:terminase family protein [Caulobacteraceae bacterium]
MVRQVRTDASGTDLGRWVPQIGPQTQFVSCKAFEAVYGGARGGGKTDAALGEFAFHAERYGRAARGLFVRRTRVALEPTIERAKAIYRPLGAKWEAQRSRFSWPNGALLYFRYIDSDEDAENYQGHSYTRVYVEEMDPISFSAPAEATLSEVNAGVVSGKFVSPAKLAGWTGVTTALGYTPLNKAGDTATALNLTPAATPAANAAGFLGLPVVTLNSTANLSTAHNGRMVRHTDSSAYSWTIPPISSAAWVLNTAIAVRNIGSGVITLARGSGVVLRKGGSSIDANVALAQWGFAFLSMEDNDVWLVQGSGLS